MADCRDGHYPERKQQRAVRRGQCQAENRDAGGPGVSMQARRDQPRNAERA